MTTVSITLQLKQAEVIYDNLPLTMHLISHVNLVRVSFILFSTSPFPFHLSLKTAKQSSDQILLSFPSCGLKALLSQEENGERKTWEGMGVEVSSASGGQELG